MSASLPGSFGFLAAMLLLVALAAPSLGTAP